MKHNAIMKASVFIFVSLFYNSYTYSVLNENNSTDIIEYVLLDQKHPCTRTCVKGAPPMICRYRFTMEWYHTLSKACYSCPNVLEDCKRPHCIPGDGVKRSVLVVNRQMPGPSIDVCQGDEIIVDVENALMGETTTIHWHGFHQYGTPYMDGVPFVTQCPIQPGSTFRYHFRATNAGTHFWHSHTGMQRADGAFGSFIVRIPELEDPHCDLYDYDLPSHVMVILDWGHEIGISKFTSHHHGDGDNKPVNLLVNGLGRFKTLDEVSNSTLYIPTARFVVEQGYRYRMRIINAEFLNCPIEVSVDNHTLTVISSDGNDFESVKAQSVVTYAGERFDFILNADQPKGLYWMRFRGLMDCDERFRSAHQVAVLQYLGESDSEYPEGEPNYHKAHRDGLQVNALNRGTQDNNSISMPELKSVDPLEPNLKKEPDFKYYVSYDFYKLDNPHFHVPNLYPFHNVTRRNQQLLTPQLNHISLKLLPFPLLSGRHLLNSSIFCNETTVRNCSQEYCECTHVVQIPLHSVVEMILIDKGFAYDANHPFHLHGHAFRVIGMERLGSNVTLEKILKLEEEGQLRRNLENPPLKDTVTVPDGGYTIIRFQASNPGYWLFHCHIEFHVELGMALVFKFGEDEEMPPVPKDFPQCGNYMYDAILPSKTTSFLPTWLKELFTTSNASSNTTGISFWTCFFLAILTLLVQKKLNS